MQRADFCLLFLLFLFRGPQFLVSYVKNNREGVIYETNDDVANYRF